MFKAAILISAAFIITSCASQEATDISKAVIGHDYAAIQTCLGIPDKTLPDKIDVESYRGRFTAEWSHKTEGTQTTTIPLQDIFFLPLTLTGSMSFSGYNDCKAIAIVEQQTV
jgi:hypothetical protein